MPMRSQKPCAQPGCPALVPGGQNRCALHAKTARTRSDAQRGTSAQRGYDAAWQSLRLVQLRAHPLCQCEDCQEGAKRLTVATVVDHIEAIEERPDLRLDPANLRSMSKPCHDRHTGRTRGWGRARQGPGRGVKSSNGSTA
jgi:5-methylcytosine-specific restriction protein A